MYSLVYIIFIYRFLSKEDKWRAATKPSPPLFPGPHNIKILLFFLYFKKKSKVEWATPYPANSIAMGSFNPYLVKSFLSKFYATTYFI